MISALQSASILLSERAPTARQQQADSPQSGLSSIKDPKDLFSINNVTSTEMKVSLYLKTGNALGLDTKNMGADFGAEVRQAFEDLKASPGGADRMAEISRKLDLDRLGLSLDQLVGAIEDPGGEQSSWLDEMLQQWLDNVDEDLRAQSETSRQSSSPVVLDDAGVYGARIG